MRKLIILIKKELKELLTLQMLLPLILSVIAFAAIGDIVGRETKKTDAKQVIAIADQDQSSLSGNIINVLSQSGFSVNKITESTVESSIEQAKRSEAVALLVIPENFEAGITNHQPVQIETYSIVNNFSISSTKGYITLQGSVATINEYISNLYLAGANASIDPSLIKQPVTTTDFVVIKDRMAEANPAQVMNFVASQTTFIPIILFLVIVMASQMIAIAVATEKENKTLETLLSAPVNRRTVVWAKMIGAGIVALLSAAVYMIGFSRYINGMTGGSITSGAAPSQEVIEKLGISLSLQGYVLLGAVLFLGILCALAISIVLGVFAQDSKSVPGVITPLMVMVLIPYILSMLLDLTTLSPVLKYIVYAIPFSYPFLAAPSILMENYNLIIFGAIYQFIFFVSFVIFAGKIFSTDYIFTMKLNFSKKNT